MTEQPIPPAVLCVDLETKSKVFVQLLPDTAEVVTMPAEKFWSTGKPSVTGLFSAEVSAQRFQRIAK